MTVYDIAVVGAGPAGMMAAIRASEMGGKVALVERNSAPGRKMLITGKGRCNITNTAPIEAVIEKFGKNGQFLRTAFSVFSNDDLIEFFKARGLELKVERQGRVFPSTDKASSVLAILEKCLSENGVNVMYNSRVSGINRKEGVFDLDTGQGGHITAKKVILATGGASYRATGSTGDGFNIAMALGHEIAPLAPGLVPLRVKEGWVGGLQGLALENIRLTFSSGSNKIVSDIGELMFTHFGVSGPLVLDLSARIIKLLDNNGSVDLSIDLKPGLRDEQLESKILHKFKTKGGTRVKNILKDILPNRLVDVFVKISGLDPDKETNQIKQEERRRVIKLLKSFPLTVTGALDIEEAMVTLGGVPTRQIDPRAMESRVVPGLYFAGEIVDTSAPSGGYNLQQAFSTGYLAGESAADVSR